MSAGIADSLMTRAATLVRVSDSASVDEYNSPVAAAVSEQIVCDLQPLPMVRRSGETEIDGVVEVGLYRLFLPSSVAPPGGRDHLANVEGYPGLVFELTGDAQAWRDPLSGLADHSETLVRVIG